MKDKRNKNMELGHPATAETAETTESGKMDAVTWFSQKLREDRKLKSSHFAPILAFFKTKNLGESETKEAFDAALKDFGF